MRAAWLISLCAALAACDFVPDEGEPAQRVDLDAIGESTPSAAPTPTPAIASACEEVTFEGERLTHCTADPQRHTITTALAPEGRAPYRSFASYRAESGAQNVAFAMNGGMYDDAGQPIGYYVEAGERLKELNRAQGPGNFHLMPNGVFFGNDDGWQVLATDQFYAQITRRPDFGTQSGPMLVIDGEIHPEITENGPSRYVRNGVGVDSAGAAHFVISARPISFGVLARYFRDGLETPNALFLDGAVSSLWDPAQERMDGLAPLGPLIVVQNRATATP